MYQQTPDQRLDIVSHVHRSGVTGGQLDQRYQEVLALLHTFQRLLLVKYLVVTSDLLSQLLSSTPKTQFVAAFCRVFCERISLIWTPNSNSVLTGCPWRSWFKEEELSGYTSIRLQRLVWTGNCVKRFPLWQYNKSLDFINSISKNLNKNSFDGFLLSQVKLSVQVGAGPGRTHLAKRGRWFLFSACCLSASMAASLRHHVHRVDKSWFGGNTNDLNTKSPKTKTRNSKEKHQHHSSRTAGTSLVFVAHYSLCFIGELCFYSTRDPIKLQLSSIILFSLELLIKDDVLLLAQSSSTVTKWHFLYFKWKQMCPSVV